ncbi:carbonate dehydratase [Noviherbaspirillum saxi]|uniref:Carbonic anhydrase 2 n=1 Tax=Noviherbaspirillum saxi TaxID=2320863 RepID=A0A3A3FZ94_9BURK|nr:carbonate dehydratase [Noviherbaspirillum saxi]RJF92409.1 carbonate dehydratase [Noviherbaspirillum saxi]
MPTFQSLFQNNRVWAKNKVDQDPTLFSRLVKQQNPEFLWIGCSDSRVPANEIVGLMPGELFVHRNLANLVLHTDFNCLSVIQFAVESLKVRDIIVCGHYECSGVAHAMKKSDVGGLPESWLRHVEDLAMKKQCELSEISCDAQRLTKLCELNVQEQVRNVSRTDILRNAWRRGQHVAVHGVVYDLADGLLHDLNVSVTGL